MEEYRIPLLLIVKILWISLTDVRYPNNEESSISDKLPLMALSKRLQDYISVMIGRYETFSLFDSDEEEEEIENVYLHLTNPFNAFRNLNTLNITAECMLQIYKVCMKQGVNVFEKVRKLSLFIDQSLSVNQTMVLCEAVESMASLETIDLQESTRKGNNTLYKTLVSKYSLKSVIASHLDMLKYIAQLETKCKWRKFNYLEVYKPTNGLEMTLKNLPFVEKLKLKTVDEKVAGINLSTNIKKLTFDNGSDRQFPVDPKWYKNVKYLAVFYNDCETNVKTLNSSPSIKTLEILNIPRVSDLLSNPSNTDILRIQNLFSKLNHVNRIIIKYSGHTMDNLVLKHNGFTITRVEKSRLFMTRDNIWFESSEKQLHETLKKIPMKIFADIVDMVFKVREGWERSIQMRPSQHKLIFICKEIYQNLYQSGHKTLFVKDKDPLYDSLFNNPKSVIRHDKVTHLHILEPMLLDKIKYQPIFQNLEVAFIENIKTEDSPIIYQTGILDHPFTKMSQLSILDYTIPFGDCFFSKENQDILFKSNTLLHNLKILNIHSVYRGDVIIKTCPNLSRISIRSSHKQVIPIYTSVDTNDLVKEMVDNKYINDILQSLQSHSPNTICVTLVNKFNGGYVKAWEEGVSTVTSYVNNQLASYSTTHSFKVNTIEYSQDFGRTIIIPIKMEYK